MAHIIFFNMGSNSTTLVSMLSGEKSQGSSKETIKETLERMKTALAEAYINLERLQCTTANAANCSRRSEQYKVGDEVVLSKPSFRS